MNFSVARDRADTVQEWLLADRAYDRWEDAGPELQAAIPPGSALLLPDELEAIEALKAIGDELVNLVIAHAPYFPSEAVVTKWRRAVAR